MTLTPGVAALILAARLVPAVVFLWAGFAKARDPNGTWSMLRDFGLGVRASDIGSRALPYVELAIGAGLVFSAPATVASACAVAVLAAFTSAIGWNLAHGRRPACRCFGQIGARPIGPATVVRNVILILFSSVALVVAPVVNDPPALAWVAAAGPALAAIVIAIALAAIGFLLVQIIAQQGRILGRLDEIEAGVQRGAPVGATTAGGFAPQPPSVLTLGAAAPPFVLPALDGSERSLADVLAAGQRVLLFFVHSTCGPCRALVPQIVRWHQELAGTVTVIVVAEGDAEENLAFTNGLPPADVFVLPDRQVSEAYGVFGTPGAILIEPNGTIGSRVAMGSGAIEALAVAAQTAPPSATASGALAVGSRAPDFNAFTPTGERVRLADWRGEELALIFWSPTCGFCRQAESDVIAWQQRGDRRIVVVSLAPDDALVAHGFTGTLLLDPGSRIGALFGARGTPMAVRISADGSVDSELATGRVAIDALFEAHVAKA